MEVQFVKASSLSIKKCHYLRFLFLLTLNASLLASSIDISHEDNRKVLTSKQELIMTEIKVYSRKICPYCDRAKDLLKKKGLEYTEIDLDQEPDKIKEMVSLSKRRTVPQIFINGHPIGGCDDLYDLDAQGKLEEYL